MTENEAKKILLAANLSPLEKTALQFLLLELDSYCENLPGEEWRNIVDEVVDYEGKYQVSNFARVRSLYRDKIKIIKPDIIHTGYLRVTLYKDGKTKSHYVHVLAAKAFIPNPENKSDVNHINGIKTDNRIENLEWTTRSENIRHAFKTGLSKQGCEHGRAKFTVEQVRDIRTNCVPGDPERGFRVFAKKYGVTHRIVSDAYYRRSYTDIE